MFLSAISDSIKRTLLKREEINISSRSDWAYNNSTWIRLTSLNGIDGNDLIRFDWQLFGGTSMNGKLRQRTADTYNASSRPMPGITSIDISNKGEMGSTRESTIKFIAWDIDQLDILEQLYMSFGTSCILEWGWSHTIDNIPISYDLSKLPPMNDNDATAKIKEYTMESGGHYDAMQGVVTNFNWDIRSDGGFDCSITLISMAAMFLQLDTHSTSKGISKKLIDNKLENGEIPEALETNIMATLTTTARRLDKSDLLYDGVLSGWRVELEVTKDESDDFFHWNDDIQYYITWKYFEDIIINHNLFFNSDTSEYTVPRLDTSDTLINYNKLLISSDPTRIILPFDMVGDSKIGFNNVRFGQFTKTTTVPRDLIAPIINGDKFNFNKILLNLTFIKYAFDNTKTLTELLKFILDDISKICGGFWDFGILINENIPSNITIVDYKTITSDKIDITRLKSYSVNSALKSVNISTDVPEAMKSEIMLGVLQKNAKNKEPSTSESTGIISNMEFGFFGKNTTNLVYKKLEPIKASKFDINNNEDFTAKKLKISEYQKNIINNVNKVYGATFIWDDGASAQNTESLRMALYKYVSEVNRPNGDGTAPMADKSAPILPIKLSFTIDGLSGLLFGNAIMIDYLPQRYLDNIYFQITNISHSISPNTWDTSIETLMRFKSPISNITNTSYKQPHFANSKIINTQSSNEPIIIDSIPTEDPNILTENIPSNYIWILDAGHGIGGGDTWKRWPPNGISDNSNVKQLQEWKFNKNIVDKLYTKLLKQGIDVKLTMTDEERKLYNDGNGKPLLNRVQTANSIQLQNPSKQCILISVHGNAESMFNADGTYKYQSKRGVAGGVSVLIQTPIVNLVTNTFYDTSNEMATDLSIRLNDVFTFPKAGKRYKLVWEHNDLYILKYANMPALLSENGFYTNPYDRQFMLSDEGINKIVNSHYDFIMNYEKR